MTICPNAPRLVCMPDSPRTRVLVEPHLTTVKLPLGYSVIVHIGAGYETDGATIPDKILDDEQYGEQIQRYFYCQFEQIETRCDLEELLRSLIGKPFDMPRLLGAIVHDALYSCKWLCRVLCDWLYKRILSDIDYNKVQLTIEYAGIRLMGWRYWNAVSDLERDRARKIITVKIVRTRNVQKEIARFLAMEEESKEEREKDKKI